MEFSPCESSIHEQLSMSEWKQSLMHFRGAKYLQQIRKRLRLPEHLLLRNLQDVASEKALRSLFTEDEIKGMMMLYHYLHPEDTPIVEGKAQLIAVLNDYRRIIKVRMAPVAYQYLLNPFDDALSSLQLQEAMGESQLWGAVHLLNFLCPTELTDEDSDSSGTGSESLRNMLAILRQSRLNRERDRDLESSTTPTGLTTTANQSQRPPRAFIVYHGDQQLLIIT